MKLLESKYRCMDLFYRSVDSRIAIGIFHNYEESFGEVFVYDFPRLTELEKAVWCFTMVIRFARGGILLVKNGSLEENTMKALDFLKNADWESFDISDEDKKELDSDMREVLRYLDWLEEKRNPKDRSKKTDSAMISAEEKNKSYETIFDISFNLSKVQIEAMVEMFKELTFFKPDSFDIGTECLQNIEPEEFYQIMSDPKLLDKHCVFRASPPWAENGHICLHYYPETGIVYIRGRSFSESENDLYEVSEMLRKFAMCRDIISASVRTVEEYNYNELRDLKKVKKLHPEMTKIKIVGQKPHLSADPEQFAAHTHEYYGMWFGCCYEMWFGKDYDKYISLKKLKTFKDCTLNETFYNGTVHIILYDSHEKFSTEKSVDRAWAFRKHTCCDRAARVWQRRGNILSHNAGLYTYEIKEGRFPHGGTRLLITYLDERGDHVNKRFAVKVHICECDTYGKHVFEETIELSEYELRESKREKKMNRSQLLKIIDESDNMSLMDDEYAFPRILQKIIDNNEQTKFAEHITDHSKIKAFAEEFNGISFLRNETVSGDELAVKICFGGIHYCKEQECAAIYIGLVINDCGIIENLYMSEDGRFLRSLNDRLFINNDGIIAYNTEDFIEYLLTKEYDYHIPVTEETYDKLCEAGWYEGRRVDISQIIKATQEHNVILTQEQRRFLEEFAGLKSPDWNSEHGFYILDKYDKYEHFYENPRDWDDYYFDDIDKNSAEYKRVTVRIGSCCRAMMSLELSPDGLLLCDGSAVGRTVMEGWQILLVGRERDRRHNSLEIQRGLEILP